jgi:3-dehydroquinate synthase
MTTLPPPLRTVEVALEHDPYPVLIGEAALERIGQRIAERGFAPSTRVLVVTHPLVAEHYGPTVLTGLREAGFEAQQLVLEEGEERKTPATVARIHDAAFAHRLERGSLIVALGGGVVGDMAGFAAATWLRGIPVVQVPTTLLAMVDAAIGGKTGVNHPGGKNLIGAFHQPRLVLIDPAVLATLPAREFRAGMAEVIKYGVIGDTVLFADLEAAARRDPDAALASRDGVGARLLQRLLERSAAAKARVVAADEKEGGLRAILNYGHTVGHAVETLTGYGTYLHGEAVALGMVVAGRIARGMGLWAAEDQARQEALIRAAGLPLELPPLDPDAVLACLQADKKVRAGQVRFVLPRAIGSVEIRDDVPPERIREALLASR